MRNRGIELFMLPDPYQLMPSPQSSPPQMLPPPTRGLEAEAEAATAPDAHSLVAYELECVVSADGVPGCQPAACLAASHLQLVQQSAKLHRYGLPQKPSCRDVPHASWLVPCVRLGVLRLKPQLCTVNKQAVADTASFARRP